MSRRGYLLREVILYAFCLLYLFLLLDVLFFMRTPFGVGAVRSLNLVPLRTVRLFLSGGEGISGRVAFANIFWNIGMFVPLGVYLPVFLQKARTGWLLLGILLFSMAAETVQWLLAMGAADIDDVILNGLGGFLGLLIFRLLLLLLRRRERARLFVAAASAAVGIPVLVIAVGTWLYNR